MNAEQAAVARNLVQEFARQLATVFETMAGTRPAVSADEALPPAAGDADALYWKQPLPPLAGSAYVVAKHEHWTTAGRHLLAAAGIEDASPEDVKSTFLETIGQAFSGLAAHLTGELRREVGTAGGQEITAGGPESSDAPWTTSANWSAMRIGVGTNPMMIELGFDPAVTDALLAPQETLPAPVHEPEPQHGGIHETDARTFDLLLDVELPVSVSFGRAHVPLKDVLKLTTGSIVELNRAVVEPVDIIVNNCVIARGEVVVVEGNFGVRIQQVVSRSERLRTIQ